MDMSLGWWQAVSSWPGFQYLQGLAAEFGVSSWPGLKAANTVEDFGGGAGKIYEAIFFFENWGEAGSRVVLRTRMDGSRLQPMQGFDDKIGSDSGEARSEGLRRVVRRDGEFSLQEDIAGIESGVDSHRCDSSYGFAVRNSPLDRGRTAVFREQRCVQVDVAERRQIEHPLRNDAAVADNDDGVGLEGGELSAEVVIVFDALGLRDRKVQLQRRLL